MNAFAIGQLAGMQKRAGTRVVRRFLNALGKEMPDLFSKIEAHETGHGAKLWKQLEKRFPISERMRRYSSPYQMQGKLRAAHSQLAKLRAGGHSAGYGEIRENLKEFLPEYRGTRKGAIPANELLDKLKSEPLNNRAWRATSHMKETMLPLVRGQGSQTFATGNPEVLKHMYLSSGGEKWPTDFQRLLLEFKSKPGRKYSSRAPLFDPVPAGHRWKTDELQQAANSPLAETVIPHDATHADVSRVWRIFSGRDPKGKNRLDAIPISLEAFKRWRDR